MTSEETSSDAAGGKGGRVRTSERAGAYAVPALSKAAEILELLASEPAGLSATDIAARLGRSMGEIYRLVVALERLDFLTKDALLDRYALSLKLFELAHRHPPTKRLIRAAIPILERLAVEAEQSCHLGVLHGDQLVILAQADSPQPMRYSVKIGATFPALETSSGIVILAHSDERVQEQFLSSLLPEARGPMAERFARALEVGHERHASAVVTGVTNLSRPVFDHAGTPLAAITIPHLRQVPVHTEIERALEMVIAAADALSAGLGWTGAAEPNPHTL
ncbi:IclR family transcriptional regulator [Arsenicitalea aurantiaca]|uniref:IclR family transcriptional regulator n=1 Tax=Arsenicitalea aurantiaca TaxID=1783274 RepID=A0A433XL17_9HYPH|nr:IclR family transcriptional regulator [Arsenicitalea aurantiaca]RUT34780.1 IclR family transcriptional regulator [Arsenicitalea aurantiaca]